MTDKTLQDNLTIENISAAIISSIVKREHISDCLEDVGLTEEFLLNSLRTSSDTSSVAKYKLNNLIGLYGLLTDKVGRETYVIKKICCDPDEFETNGKNVDAVIEDMNKVISSDFPNDEYLEGVVMTKVISHSQPLINFKGEGSGYEVYLVQDTNELDALSKTHSMVPVFYFTGPEFDVKSAKSMDELVNNVILYHNPEVLKELVDSKICSFYFE